METKMTNDEMMELGAKFAGAVAVGVTLASNIGRAKLPAPLKAVGVAGSVLVSWRAGELAVDTLREILRGKSFDDLKSTVNGKVQEVQNFAEEKFGEKKDPETMGAEG